MPKKKIVQHNNTSKNKTRKLTLLLLVILNRSHNSPNNSSKERATFLILGEKSITWLAAKLIYSIGSFYDNILSLYGLLTIAK